MGLDLTLLPLEGSEGNYFAHTVLQCERRRRLFDNIMEATKFMVFNVERVNSYLATMEDGEKGYGELTEDEYGDRLSYIKASHLVEMFAEHPEVRDNDTNRAVWAYLKHINQDTKIVLYWS